MDDSLTDSPNEKGLNEKSPNGKGPNEKGPDLNRPIDDRLKPQITAKLSIDLDAIAHNWTALNTVSGRAGAAVKANAYGLGVIPIVKKLYESGCRDFFVAHWAEADALKNIIPQHHISVLNGIDAHNLEYAKAHQFKPVLNSPQQIIMWRGGGRCDVMLDSGINRLGIDATQCNAALFNGINIDIVMSHMASADQDVPQNEAQRHAFNAMAKNIQSQRKSLANSAAIMLGKDYHYNLSRPGISLYGGISRPEHADIIKPVLSISAQILQVRNLPKGSMVGYNGTYICPEDMTVATAAIGYADGYLRGFSNKGHAYHDANILPLIGRVSMDLITLDAKNSPHIKQGDWIFMDYDLKNASEISSLSQYELLTCLGNRFERAYI